VAGSAGDRITAEFGEGGEDGMTDTITLSPRELQVITAIAMGRTEDQIALELGISPRTVRRYKSDIRRKCETFSMPHTVYVVTMAGLLENVLN
jgi:DNA-binding NarL/FixJ family response regulator